MRHVRESDLERLAAFLADLDAICAKNPALKARKKGVYYMKSKAFLHFHEDAGELFADVKLDGIAFDRFNVSRRNDQHQLLRAIKDELTP